LGIVGMGETIADAEKACQAVADTIKGPFFHRRDIGTEDLIARRVAHMNKLRRH
jgi:phosphoribosylamine-glycine ligase